MNGENVDGNPRLLTCWKDIANYLGKGVRTVQRWETEFGLPVRRPAGVNHKSAVLAHTRDLDAWVESRWSERRAEKATNGKPLLGLSDLIQTSKALRSAHLTLMEETSAALEILVESCNQLDETRRGRMSAPPPVEAQ
jgi:hypothetical protein